MGAIKPGLPAQMNVCTIFHLAYKDLRKGDYTSFVPESYFPISFLLFSDSYFLKSFCWFLCFLANVQKYLD